MLLFFSVQFKLPYWQTLCWLYIYNEHQPSLSYSMPQSLGYDSTAKLVIHNKTSHYSTHHIQTVYIQHCRSPDGCWPRSGMCRCLFCLVWWWLIPCPPQSCARCLAALLHLLTTAPVQVWEKKQNIDTFFCILLLISFWLHSNNKNHEEIFLKKLQPVMKRNHISSQIYVFLLVIATTLKLKMPTYMGLPMETHSNFRYCPSCGIISECVISRWGASVKRRQNIWTLWQCYVLQALTLTLTKYNSS